MELPARQALQRVYVKTRIRIRYKEWDELITIDESKSDIIYITILTYDVKVLVREDQYNRRGTRFLCLKHGPSGWYTEIDTILWDEDFEPFVFEKIGRRRTVEEFTEQREWEKLCHRPGSTKTPLDSYGRVLGYKSTDRMERYW